MTNRDPSSQIRLDDLYFMTVHIYSEQNAERAASATFAHFIEVCGVLATYDRKKKRESISVEDALCKALGWFFPLMAKFKIASVEDLVFRKYPYACPYCRKTPHNDAICKTVRGSLPTVNHAALTLEQARNIARKPKSLTEWQAMFQEIYPRAAHDAPGRSTLGLFEELGELAEAIRVFDRHPKFLVGEAADIFSYLMGIANEYALMVQMEEDREFSFEAEYLKRYPGLCPQCGNQICKCPSIPEATVGRMAKELALQANDSIFRLDFETLHVHGEQVSTAVMSRVGRSSVTQLPLDRGEANEAFVEVIKRLADGAADAAIKEQLQAASASASNSTSLAGSRAHQDVSAILAMLHDLWPKVAPVAAELAQEQGTLTGKMARMLERVRVLLVISNPADSTRLELDVEARAIAEAIKQSRYRDFISVTTLLAATTDDLRRALLENPYDILHFSGHGSPDGPVFSDLENMSADTTLHSLGTLVKRYPVIQCVILNACWILSQATQPIANFTIGMSAQVDDAAAIEFARGFYDALGAGKDFAFAIAEGETAVALKGLSSGLPLVVLQK